ncbi:hypothetical protein GCM10010885_03180 [Alicyclobacillus cellulosilyticus]|uniref:Uncharacterized protein n=1 Tax=Alicyclobacillus cellulosilyticus TaxID=1003997 RepID=A0A917K0Z5_9BACL|nr:hypothetical protein [Alicyclobacillus cellulosilyticus]GGI96975.1 hypothetical protein GCM10010885_03180 [Alicyclobacillus cellulosilyticus]
MKTLAEGGYRFLFPKAKPYVFLYENAPLVWLRWDRDDAHHLFLIRNQLQDTLTLDYPGDAFTQRVLDDVSSIFFVELREEGAEQGRKLALGCYFTVGRQPYGAYYERDRTPPDVVLLRVDGEPPRRTLAVPDEEEYAHVAGVFYEAMRDWLDIRRAGDPDGHREADETS